MEATFHWEERSTNRWSYTARPLSILQASYQQSNQWLLAIGLWLFLYVYVIIASNQAMGPCSHHLQRKFRSCQTCYQVNFFLPLVTLHSQTHFLRIGYNSRADYMNRLHCLFGTLLPSSILANTKSVLISIYAEKAEP